MNNSNENENSDSNMLRILMVISLFLVGMYIVYTTCNNGSSLNKGLGNSFGNNYGNMGRCPTFTF